MSAVTDIVPWLKKKTKKAQISALNDVLDRYQHEFDGFKVGDLGPINGEYGPDGMQQVMCLESMARSKLLLIAHIAKMNVEWMIIRMRAGDDETVRFHWDPQTYLFSGSEVLLKTIGREKTSVWNQKGTGSPMMFVLCCRLPGQAQWSSPTFDGVRSSLKKICRPGVPCKDINFINEMEYRMSMNQLIQNSRRLSDKVKKEVMSWVQCKWWKSTPGVFVSFIEPIPKSANIYVAMVCWVCGEAAEVSCAGCRYAVYCSEKCQADGWHLHHQMHCEYAMRNANQGHSCIPPSVLRASPVPQNVREPETSNKREMLALPPPTSSSVCVVCGAEKAGLCKQCKKVRYCGRACQVADWKAGHKAVCKGQ